MNNINQIPTSRIEAFSNGVIAIIIIVMVFDLKLQEIPTDKTVWNKLNFLVTRKNSLINSIIKQVTGDNFYLRLFIIPFVFIWIIITFNWLTMKRIMN